MMKKNIRIFIMVLSILSWMTGVFPESFYLSEDFSGTMNDFVNNGWQTNFYYGRDGIRYIIPNDDGSQGSTGGAGGCVTEMTQSTISLDNGMLKWRGTPNWANAPMQSMWVGHMVKYTNKEFTASAEQPFGYELIRKYAWIDPIVSCKGPSGRQQAEASFWLVSENDISADNEQFADFICFYDYSQAVEPNKTYDTSVSRLGYFYGNNHHFDLGNLLRPNGTSINLTNSSIFSWEWNYDDDRSPAGTANTNDLGIRLTHNGSEISIYVNPDPYDHNAYPNEYCLLSTIPVTWNKRIEIMFGHEVNRFDQERVDIDIDNVLVRTVADTIKSEINPEYLPDNQVRFACIITPEFSKTDAGISDIIIKKTAILSDFHFMLKSTELWIDINADGVLEKLNVVLEKSNSDANPVLGTAFLRSPDESSIEFRLCRTSDKVNNVVKFGPGNKEIKIFFSLTNKNNKKLYKFVKNNEKFIHTFFSCFCDSISYDKERYSRHSTTGAMRTEMLGFSKRILNKIIKKATFSYKK